MKVVILKNIKGLGNAGDIKEVAPGYAKNCLFKNGYAVLATAQSIKNAEKKKEEERKKIEEDKAASEALFKKLNGLKIKMSLKFGDGDHAFGSISTQNITDKLKEKNFEINPSNIILDSNIKTLGEHVVLVKLGFDLEAKLSIIVEKE